MDRIQIFVAAAAIAVAGLAGLWFGSQAPDPPPVLETKAPEPQSITVHVAGAVAVPGLVTLPPDARVADAVAAAGGMRADANPASLNLAAPVADGQLVTVPVPGEAPADAPGDGRLRLNDAGVADLESLPGIGPVTAQRIIDHRAESGPFAVVEDLLDVPGIGEAKLASLRDYLVVP